MSKALKKDPKAPFGYKKDGTPRKSAAGRKPISKSTPKKSKIQPNDAGKMISDDFNSEIGDGGVQPLNAPEFTPVPDVNSSPEPPPEAVSPFAAAPLPPPALRDTAPLVDPEPEPVEPEPLEGTVEPDTGPVIGPDGKRNLTAAEAAVWCETVFTVRDNLAVFKWQAPFIGIPMLDRLPPEFRQILKDAECLTPGEKEALRPHIIKRLQALRMNDNELLIGLWLTIEVQHTMMVRSLAAEYIAKCTDGEPAAPATGATS